jgi:DNA-binding transcriptional MocR family regulator
MRETKTMEKTFLYKEVAERIAALVAGGTFRIGDRLPSIREMSRQAQVSINTVKIAYSHLEDRCLIEGRPQSGYYVCPRPLALPREPTISLRKLEPQEISSSNLVWQLMKDIVDSEKVQFGAAIPDPELVPARKLGRILSVACRNHAAESICNLISRHDYDDEPFIYLKSISL